MRATLFQDVFKELRTLYGRSLLEKHIEFFVDIIERPLPLNVASKDLLPVLASLIDCSIYSVKGNSGAWIHVNVVVENKNLCLRIWDNGHGVPPATGECLNERDHYFLGLGLAQEWVNQNGGSLELEASLGARCFCLRLPVAMSLDNKE